MAPKAKSPLLGLAPMTLANVKDLMVLDRYEDVGGTLPSDLSSPEHQPTGHSTGHLASNSVGGGGGGGVAHNSCDAYTGTKRMRSVGLRCVEGYVTTPWPLRSRANSSVECAASRLNRYQVKQPWLWSHKRTERQLDSCVESATECAISSKSAAAGRRASRNHSSNSSGSDSSSSITVLVKDFVTANGLPWRIVSNKLYEPRRRSLLQAAFSFLIWPFMGDSSATSAIREVEEIVPLGQPVTVVGDLQYQTSFHGTQIELRNHIPTSLFWVTDMPLEELLSRTKQTAERCTKLIGIISVTGLCWIVTLVLREYIKLAQEAQEVCPATKAKMLIDCPESAQACIICMTARAATIFVPCGHECACKDCANDIRCKRMNKCPICRASVRYLLQVFK
eukprot:Selendium_serpulae@DN6337_c2_g1_i4.p1